MIATVAEQSDVEYTSQEKCTPTALSVSGCHGGAGVSTFVELLSAFPHLFSVHSEDALFSRPLSTLADSVVLVAMENAQGSESAVKMLNAADAVGLTPSAIVLMSDSVLPPPPLARQRARLLRSRVRNILHFPYLPQLRYSSEATANPHELPERQARAVTQLIESLHAAVNNSR